MFEHVATFGGNAMTLTGAGDPVRLHGVSITPDFLAVLRVSPAMGRRFEPGEERAVLLSSHLWRTLFRADPEVLGKTISLDGVGHTIVGVMAGLETLAQRLPLGHGENRSEFVARVIPLKDSVVGNIQNPLLIFAGAVAFVLLIACAKMANLLLIRATTRRQEISVRAALGASPWRLMQQLLTESMLVSLAGGAAAKLLAVVAVPLLLALAPAGKIPRIDEIQLGWGAFAFTLGLSALTGFVFGLVPASDLTHRELRESFSGQGRAVTGRSGGFRNALVVGEIALALVLLDGAGLMLKSFARMRAVDPGFQPEHVLTMTVDLPDSTYRTTPF